MEKLSAKKYRELLRLRAEGKLDNMECTKRLYKILKNLYFDGIKILDVACGVGHYFRKIRELGHIEYLGIDLDTKAIDIAKKIWKNVPNAKFDVQDIHHLDLEDNSFDVVCCYNFLMNLEDYKKPLAELIRVSKKYIIVRSLFDDEEKIESVDVAEDYVEVYPSGKVWYNTYARGEVGKFLKDLGCFKFRFIKDNVSIPKESIEKQIDYLGVYESEFTKADDNRKKEYFKGRLLNYEILFIKKPNRPEVNFGIYFSNLGKLV
jgi:ubiquinone/menaquinone biosynthesis C-methylase UbiE